MRDGEPPIPLDGVLIVDKPAGPTSHDVVARVRRALRTRRIGHTGTLDPFATGVLPLVIGRATRLAQFLSASDKQYEAVVTLGAATDTYDADGQRTAITPLARHTELPDRQRVEAALDEFRGTFLQTPPPFSAKKVEGVRAHTLARGGAAVVLRPVTVRVDDLVLLETRDGRCAIRLTCSAGFYVRSLAHDLGLRLGCGAHLERLRRTRAGEFGLDVAVPLDAIERDPESARASLLPMSAMLTDLPAVVLGESGLLRLRHGSDLSSGNLAGHGDLGAIAPSVAMVRLLDMGGALLGLARPTADSRLLHPVVVLM